MRPKLLVCVGAALCAGASASASGQASYAEGFDDNGRVNGCEAGPSGLIARGWVFRNQSLNGCGAWRDGYGHFPPQEGEGYLAADADPYTGPTAIWAIVPAVANQVAGDQISVWVVNDAPGCTFEVRYSPSGGTSTGSGPADVGDFGVVLLELGQQPRQWREYTMTIPAPGNGRIAFRQFVPETDPGGEETFVDSLVVGMEPTGGCPDEYPPLPGPGETVTWSLADSPYRICIDTTIPAGGTVLVEPGVIVNIDPDCDLLVEGMLLAQGEPGGSVTFNGNDRFGDFGRINVVGRAELDWCVINCPVVWQSPAAGTTIIVRDSTIRADQTGALGFTSPYITGHPPTLVVERTLVVGNGDPADMAYRFFFPACHTRLSEVTVHGCGTLFDGYALLDSVTSTGAPQSGIGGGDRLRNLYVNRVSVTGAAGAALALGSTRNAFVGPENTLQDCEYPVAANSLLPGSIVPATGNAFNHVLADGATQLESDRLWTDVGVPWGWNSPNYAFGNVVISPGVTVLMYPDMFMINQGGRISAEGLPGAPITFTPLDPARPWLSIEEYAPHGSRYDHCVFEGASRRALLAFEGLIHVDSSVVRDNATGLETAENGTLKVRKTLLTANGVGVVGNSISGVLRLSTPDAPNAIAGNATGIFIPGIDVFLPVFDARHVWWGHPTGPDAPQNPGGQGDSIEGIPAEEVEVFPFLVAPPDFSNHPPVVRVPHEPASRLATGSKIILRWTAEDDDAIVSQRVLFSEEGNFDGLFRVVGDGLPPDQRALEVTVPDVPRLTGDSYFRVEAADSLGQIGWDDFPAFIAAGDTDVESAVTSDFGGQTIRCGTDLPTITWEPVHDPFGLGVTIAIMLDADEQRFDLGGWFANRGYWNATRTPYASTDLARIAVTISNSGNDSETFYGEYFSLRPDPLLGDEPPAVQLHSPQGGSYAGGGVVPVSWGASDDESVRSIQIQASYDGGSTWHTVARDLPGDSTLFGWELPPSGGIPDVRVRVIARDLRFQSSSSTGGPFSITPGGACPADFNGDGVVDTRDVVGFLNAWAAQGEGSDFNGDGLVNTQDVLAFLNAWNAGC